MRVAIVFLLFLCFLLLKGYGDVYAGAHHNRVGYILAGQIYKTQQKKSLIANQGAQLMKNSNLNEKKEDLISVEDDDEEPVFNRKYVVLVKYFITLAWASVLIHFYSCFKNRLPFCKHLSYASSYKYILQRVLRL